MESTKAGFITTGFTGVVKKFNTVFNWNGEEFSNTLLKINVKDMDTDNGSRDDKMNEQTFSSDKLPQLVVQIGGPLKAGVHNNVEGLLTVRGKIKEITLNLEITISEEKDYVIKGTSQMSIKALEIPDPSIFIASVRDRVDLSFQIKGKVQE
jgi:polyisoprenoid-binding protein YceI